MPVSFWIRRFLLVFAVAAVVLAVAQFLLRDRTPAEAAMHGVLWGAISAAIYTAMLWRRVRSCKVSAQALDLPGLQD